jgi:uncharacterized damage-inducible protein DinB
MHYESSDITSPEVPRAAAGAFQHAVDIYAGETNKTASAWRIFEDSDLPWSPHPRSSTIAEIMRHQLLSERRFFSEFLAHPEPPASDILPAEEKVEAFTTHLVELARKRLGWLAAQSESDWLRRARFFDVERERIWIFWRRVLHSAHHRTQLTVYARLLEKPVPPTYGPTADVNWAGADPTLTVESADRSSANG